jgi:uncharacterized membrane-anchored protein YhcB (DUF1043 family)
MVMWLKFVIAFFVGVIIGLKIPRERKAFVIHGGYENGKEPDSK